MTIQEILASNDLQLKRSLFIFNVREEDERIRIKFNLWARYFFPKYFTSRDAPFHKEVDLNRIKAYKSELSQFVDIGFRGCGKTARTKLFIAYCIANDEEHFRRYIRCLSADIDNAKQSITDVYNMFMTGQMLEMYPEVFEKTSAKREETMGSFTTATGIKVISNQIGVDQRGNIMEDSRADFDWYDDIETRTTIRSAKITKKIGENMEEARTGLAKGGSSIYTANYFSEMGNVHNLVIRGSNSKVVTITPILNPDGNTAWERFTLADIEQMKLDDEDFAGERMCSPSASKDILFDRESLDKQEKRLPIREVAGLKIFREFNPSHRYASGHDVAGGVGLDSSTSVFIDFDTIPVQVVATFANNTIKPDIFGDEVIREANIFGGCLVCPEENNHGHTTIARVRQLDGTIFIREKDKYGWNTNGVTKPKMLFALAKAVEDGHILLNDKDLIQELMSYTRNDLIDTEKDPRLTTRHFDLLVACAIAYQMKDHARIKKDPLKEYIEEYVPLYPSIGL